MVDMFLCNPQQGCYAICNHNCEACEIIVESNTISSIASGGKKVNRRTDVKIQSIFQIFKCSVQNHGLY